jgi:hypothetical protein
MSSAAIDACCLIDLFASGHAEAILRASGHTWHVPMAVQDEVQFVRQPDPADAGKLIRARVDLQPLIEAGVLTLCRPEDQRELDRFTQYAVQFRSDGEAMCLAVAESRGWLIATDDRKVIRLAQRAGLTVLSCPQLVKSWSAAAGPEEAVLAQALKDIERCAQFRPNPSMPEYRWWLNSVRK